MCCVTLGKSLLSGCQIPNEGLTGSVPLHIWEPSYRLCCSFSLRLTATGPLLLLNMKVFLNPGNQEAGGGASGGEVSRMIPQAWVRRSPF